MVYIPALDQVQLGAESTWGTSVSATSKLGLIEDITIDPNVDVELFKDIRSSLSPGHTTVLNSHRGMASINGVATYEDLPYVLDSLLMTATPGSGPGYKRDYDGQVATAPTRSKYTLYKGSSGKVQKLLGAVFNEYSLKIESNKAWKYSAKLIGKSVADGSLASLSDRTQTPIHANVTSCYIDSANGTIGNTAITALLFSADLNIKNGVGLVSPVGSLYPSAYVDGRAELSLKLKMSVDTDTAGYLTSILSTSVVQKLIRIKATTGSSQIAQFDIGGFFAAAPKVNTDQDGVSTFDFDINAVYNTTLGNWMASSVTNSVSAMP